MKFHCVCICYAILHLLEVKQIQTMYALARRNPTTTSTINVWEVQGVMSCNTSLTILVLCAHELCPKISLKPWKMCIQWVSFHLPLQLRDLEDGWKNEYQNLLRNYLWELGL